MADSPIQSLADLKDATIGMASDRDLITTVIALDSIGKTLESMNVTTVVVGNSGPVMAGALTKQDHRRLCRRFIRPCGHRSGRR